VTPAIGMEGRTGFIVSLNLIDVTQANLHSELRCDFLCHFDNAKATQRCIASRIWIWCHLDPPT
jgi:hypothetical protein